MYIHAANVAPQYKLGKDRILLEGGVRVLLEGGVRAFKILNSKGDADARAFI